MEDHPHAVNVHRSPVVCQRLVGILERGCSGSRGVWYSRWREAPSFGGCKHRPQAATKLPARRQGARRQEVSTSSDIIAAQAGTTTCTRCPSNQENGFFASFGVPANVRVNHTRGTFPDYQRSHTRIAMIEAVKSETRTSIRPMTLLAVGWASSSPFYPAVLSPSVPREGALLHVSRGQYNICTYRYFTGYHNSQQCDFSVVSARMYLDVLELSVAIHIGL